MRLINVGLGRTGTTSLKAALELLGFAPVYHTTDLFRSGKEMDLWEAALEGGALSLSKGEQVDWRAFFADYDVADWPAALLYRDIINAHPEAKVLLTVRDPEQWFESINGMGKQVQRLKLPIPRLRRIKRFVDRYALNGLFGGKADDRTHMIGFFEQYIEEIKAFVPEQRLLVYNVREGWDPLCDFLDVETPQQPFPRLNQRAGIRGLIMNTISNLRD